MYPIICVSQKIKYEYDSTGKIIEVVHNDSSKIFYQYDKNSNRTSLQASINPNSFPIELLNFTGKSVSVSLNRLNWTTTNEINNSGFSLERSDDGRIFQLITWVKATTSPKDRNEYSFDDTEVKGGNSYYYRLKQVDKDGTFTYSNTILISTLNPNYDFSVKVFPNPTSGDFTLSIENYSSINHSLTYVLVNTLGQEVIRGSATVNKSSDISIPLDIEKYPSGTYKVQVVFSNQQKLNQTLIKK
ncbi:MAG: T9SS type A sorting domain-containing protein [Bacteroidota bacterium]